MIESLSLQVAAHLWQSTLFVAIVWLATLALRRHGARVRCWLWTTASVKFLVPFSWLMSFGERFEWRTAAVIAQPAATFVVEEILAPPGVAAVTSTATAHPAALWPWLMASLWAMGFAGVVFWWWRQWCLVRGALRHAKPVELGPAHDLGGLQVLSSPWTFEPGVVGIWRPVLLLPDGFADRLSSAQLSALIAHERSHIRSHDNLAAAVHMLAEALFWFHPLVWWIERRLIDERERACDEDVLRSGNLPSDYAEGILAVCRLSVRAPLPCVAGVTGSNVQNRIRDIMTNRAIAKLSVARKAVLACVGAIVVVAPILAQSVARSPATEPRFEVVSIRENKTPVLDPEESSISLMPGGRFVTTKWPLRQIILMAFGLQPQQLVDAPDWIDTARYDISATAGGPLSQEMADLAIQRMLADRFNLAVHRETREFPIFALTLARSDGRLGPKITKSAVDCKAIMKANMAARGDGPRIEVPQLPNGRPACLVSQRFGRVLAGGSTMADLALLISRTTGRIVQDRTKLGGGYNIDLEFTPDSTVYAGGTPPPGAPLDPNAPSFFTALEDQLGLKLESVRAPIEVLVIDGIERPTEN